MRHEGCFFRAHIERRMRDQSGGAAGFELRDSELVRERDAEGPSQSRSRRLSVNGTKNRCCSDPRRAFPGVARGRARALPELKSHRRVALFWGRARSRTASSFGWGVARRATSSASTIRPRKLCSSFSILTPCQEIVTRLGSLDGQITLMRDNPPGWKWVAGDLHHQAIGTSLISMCPH